MESLSTQDIHYLMALNASEESDLIEVARDFERWVCEKSEVLSILRGLIEDDTILVSKLVDMELEDLEKPEALALTNAWDRIRRNDLVLCLSESGIKRWETYDWGITRERARYLMLGQQGD
jgi:hypothetical protein